MTPFCVRRGGERCVDLIPRHSHARLPRSFQPALPPRTAHGPNGPFSGPETLVTFVLLGLEAFRFAQARPWRRANAVAAARELTLSLARMLATWFLAVRGLM